MDKRIKGGKMSNKKEEKMNYEDFLVVIDTTGLSPYYDTDPAEGKRYTLIPAKEKFELFEVPMFESNGFSLVEPILFPISVFVERDLTENISEEEMKQTAKAKLEDMKNEIAKKFLSLLAYEWNVSVEEIVGLKEKMGNVYPLL
jgi:hypothetical protein